LVDNPAISLRGKSMNRAALSDVSPPLVEQRDDALLVADEASAESLRSLQEKIETAFALPDETPPLTPKSPFDAGTQRQAAIVGNLDARISRLEDGAEIAHLRETIRQVCNVISGLAMEQERGASERDEKIAALAQALHGQLNADRERLDALELRVVNSEVSSARGFEETRAGLRHLEERMQTADGHNEDLAYNMRMLRAEVSNLNQAAVALRKLEERVEAGDMRHEDLSRRTVGLHDELSRRSAALKEDLNSAGETAAAAARALETRLQSADARHEDLTRDMNRLKGDVLSEAALALREHRTQMEQAEKAIAELKDRNARSVERIESLTDTLGAVSRKLEGGTDRLAMLYGDIGNLGRKIDGEAAGAQLLAERLGTVEKWIARSQDRERAQAELHARLANSLLTPSQD
jgi:chromosome segregation ATPase